MKKSIRSRIRITKNGKGVRRTMGLCHSRSNKSANQMKRKTSSNSATHSLVAKILNKPGLL